MPVNPQTAIRSQMKTDRRLTGRYVQPGINGPFPRAATHPDNLSGYHYQMQMIII